MTTIIDIADAVVTELSSGSFSLSFVPQRRVLPEYELSGLNSLLVTVVPRGVEITGSSRSTSQLDYQIDIGIQQKVGKNVDSDVATLVTFADEVMKFMLRRVLSGVPSARWLQLVHEPIYSPDHLADRLTFTSVMTLTYRVIE